MLAVLLAALALPPSTPPPPPGAVVRLQNWSGRAEAVVTVRAVSPGPTAFVDAAGATHHAVTITYVYNDAPARAFQTTLGWFLKHVQPPAAAPGVPFHDAVSFAGAAAVNPFVGPPPPPRSNQQIGDGVQRPADALYHVPEFAAPRR